ncbi:MAG: ATP-binding protein [Deltaproteobacteria bacterium]|nr:ATP-binding protein [Deltaproteobacteria bacterium]
MGLPFYSRALQKKLLKPGKGTQKIKLIFGPRQSGKSTLLYHHLMNSGNTMVVNLQDRRQRRRYEVDDGLLIRELEAEEKVSVVFIDEIQKVPALLDDVQYLYDKKPGRYRFYLTGSSARQVKRRSANLLPGRVHDLLLSPVMQAEQRDSVLLPVKMPKGRRFPLRTIEDYLIYGNLPGLCHESRASWNDTLSSYAELYIENEIRQENIVNNIGAFQKFLKLAALESGRFINFTKLARAIGVAVNTLRNFYQVLEDTYVGVHIPPFAGGRKRITKAPRFLFFDLGVRHVLAELPLDKSLLALDAGEIFEQWVLAELYYRCRFHGRNYRLSTWRTASGAEVDAILETPKELIPIEIKWTDSPSRADARHVETFMEINEKKSKKGYVICRAPRKQKLTQRTTVLPWDKF